MFASVWQLLTAIFVFSALTKLVYKLIKQEDPRANSHSSFRGQGAAGRRAQQQLNQQQLDRQGGEEWYNLVHLNQQQQQLFAPNLGLGPVGGGGGGQPDEFLATPSDQDGEESSEEEEPQVQELTDEDDEFEEALSQVFSGQASSPLSREREQEERRLRWLTRQQFRRQLHRLSNSAAASSLDLTSRRSASSSEYLDACSSSSSSSSRVSLNLPQQQVVASRAHDKNNGNTQQATTNKQTLWPGQGNTAPAAAAAAGGCTSSSGRFVVNQSEVSSASSSSLHANIRENTQQQNAQFKKRASSHLLHLSNLSQLIAEVFLVEPIKLTCTIVRQTFKHFCAFLDFIEGIEAPLTEEQLVGTGPRSTGSGGRGPIATGGRGLGNPTTSKLASTSRIGNFQHNQAQRTGGDSQTPATTTKRSHPNYFHRRYFSQRSLSAALLSDNPDRQQQGGPTRPLV